MSGKLPQTYALHTVAIAESKARRIRLLDAATCARTTGHRSRSLLSSPSGSMKEVYADSAVAGSLHKWSSVSGNRNR